MTTNGSKPEAETVTNLWAVIAEGDDGEAVAAMPTGGETWMPLVSNVLEPLLELDFAHMAADLGGRVHLRHFKAAHDEGAWTADGESAETTGARRMRWGTEADFEPGAPLDPEANLGGLSARVEQAGLLEQIASCPFIVQVWNRPISEVTETTTSTRFAVELGAAMLFDKPLVVAAVRGQELPEAVRRLAAGVVELEHDPETVAGLVEMQEKLEPFDKRYGADS
jgi:hypothetical protein